MPFYYFQLSVWLSIINPGITILCLNSDELLLMEYFCLQFKWLSNQSYVHITKLKSMSWYTKGLFWKCYLDSRRPHLTELCIRVHFRLEFRLSIKLCFPIFESVFFKWFLLSVRFFISEIINHVTCCKFYSSPWLKLQQTGENI